VRAEVFSTSELSLIRECAVKREAVLLKHVSFDRSSIVDRLDQLCWAAISACPEDVDIFNVAVGEHRIAPVKRATSVEALSAYMRNGFSVRINRAERFSDLLSLACEGLELSSQAPCFVNLYWHPSQSRGLGEDHADDPCYCYSNYGRSQVGVQP
jgi:hypothetical protein